MRTFRTKRRLVYRLNGELVYVPAGTQTEEVPRSALTGPERLDLSDRMLVEMACGRGTRIIAVRLAGAVRFVGLGDHVEPIEIPNEGPR